MPYIVTREVTSLGLKVGDELKHEKGKLPKALTFDAVWKEPVKEVKTAEDVEPPKPTKRTATKAK